MKKDELRAALSGPRRKNVLLGTSSWKYEGWLGQLYSPERYEYRGKVAKSRFEANCLEEYAEVFPTVCADSGFYRFPDSRYLEKVYAQVPDDFRMSWKVTDEITIRQFPNQPRHGERAGKRNDNFLNAELFAEAFLAPMEEHKAKTGVLMFEFSQFHKGDFERGRDFVEALDAFLGRLPKGWQYGVEIRNKGFLQADYFAALRSHNVAHVFNSWTRMPDVIEQTEMDGAFTTDFFAARFLLKPGRAYQEAVDLFSPYERVQEPYPPVREGIAKLASTTTEAPSYIFVNNRAEGNAIETLLASLRDAGFLPPAENPAPPQEPGYLFE